MLNTPACQALVPVNCESTRPMPRGLWSLLRDRRLDGHKFRRQYPIGSYIADFACFESMLIVEADGGQHADNPDLTNDEPTGCKARAGG